MNTGSSENELMSNYFPRQRNKKPMKTASSASSQECVEENTKKAKSRSYANVCTSINCDGNQTKYIVGRYKPVLLTKLNKAENIHIQRSTVRTI